MSFAASASRATSRLFTRLADECSLTTSKGDRLTLAVYLSREVVEQGGYESQPSYQDLAWFNAADHTPVRGEHFMLYETKYIIVGVLDQGDRTKAAVRIKKAAQ